MTAYEPLGLGVPGYRAWYCPETGSTNDDALERAEVGETEGLVLVAGVQSRGRGRQGRTWHSQQGSSLAFSVLFRPTPAEASCLARFTALGALALVEVLRENYHADALLKWPNDVLLGGKKVSGVLPEVSWQNGQPVGVVLGMGVNLRPGTTPPGLAMLYPASDLQAETGQEIPARELLALILAKMNALRGLLTHEDFISLWNSRLAFRGQFATLNSPEDVPARVRVVAVNGDGSLSVVDETGAARRFYSAEFSS